MSDFYRILNHESSEFCRAFTRPDVPRVDYPDGFQGNSIPIDGALVARLCHERLTLSEEADD